MLYVNVALGLPPEGPFDYLVPESLEHLVKAGQRVWVNFRNKKEVAYVVGVSNKTGIKKIKEISSVIDSEPVLDASLLQLTRMMARYYCCSWGEAIETALPEELRKGKKVPAGAVNVDVNPGVIPLEEDNEVGTVSLKGNGPVFDPPRPLFVQGFERLPVYLRETGEQLAAKKSVIILCTNIPSAERMEKIIRENFSAEVFISFRKQPDELEAWNRIRGKEFCVVIGTRSAVFAPVNNPGLIIVDHEEDQVYKQEQSPHYHARRVALMRGEVQGAKVILGSHVLSLEGYYLSQEGGLDLESVAPGLSYPKVEVIDARRTAYSQGKRRPMLSKYLSDAIQATLLEKGRVFLAANRKGFATAAVCHNCNTALKCPRCNINLVFHFQERQLKCHHCNFTMSPPDVCPNCNAGYIKYFGLGTEKVENELARIFPQARIGSDIVVATASAGRLEEKFDLVGVLEVDDLFNRVDFRAAEKAFFMLSGLTGLTSKRMIIQSSNAGHYCLRALVKNDPRIFYKEELRQRRQLNFAPFRHMILVKIRGTDQEKVKKDAQDIFQRLGKARHPGVKLLSLGPAQPAKLRGNFYYQILMRSPVVEKAGEFLRSRLKGERFSGIIITVDVDPV